MQVLERLCVLVAAAVALSGVTAQAQSDPLPSWNEGPTKEAIVRFVKSVTTQGTPDFVPASKRIATFDNDGTLWCEQPVYTQVVFAFDRIKQLAKTHPDWQSRPIFKAVLEDDIKTILAASSRDRLELLASSHAGMITDEFRQIVSDWLFTAKHPRFNHAYTELVYQPMLELLTYLRANEFKTFIVSGGGIEFMRPWTEQIYGIPPEQVVGSSIKFEYQTRDDIPVLLRLPEIDFIDDHAGKPVGIERAIGRRPILAFGNSDGDYEMLRWTTSGPGPRLGLILHHTDGAREYEYDRKSPVGRLSHALDDAPKYGWTVVDMKLSWRRVFAFEK